MTELIAHRINTIEELLKLPKEYGAEVDLRDGLDGRIYMQHDPFTNGEDFENFLSKYKHGTLILNIKSERIEFKILQLLERFEINDYFETPVILEPRVELYTVYDFMGKELPGLAIVLDMPIQGADEKEQFAILTKSFGEFIGLKNSAYVDINNCPFAPQLLNRGFAKDTGLYKESGFCSYPLWTFEETVLKETGGEKYERYARAYDEYMESSFIGMMGAEDETGEEICTGMMM